MPVERLANLGYAAIGKEVTAGVSVIPSVFLPLYKSTLNTNLNFDEDNPIMGVRSMPFNQFPGQRSHEGQIEVLAEPNTAKYLFDMLLTIGNVSGSDPYTWPFTEGLSNSYTMDVCKGQVVERYFGVMAESIEPSFDKDKMKFTLDVSARGSLIARQIATISTTTITLDTTYDPVPNKGFVQADLVRVMKVDGSATLDTVIASSGVNADGITLTLGASAASFSTGDIIFLRAQTPSFSLQNPFLWARSEFRFGANAGAALTAAQTRQEQGSKWKISHKFEKKQGSDRSGSFDPDSLVRLQTQAEINLKMFFDQPVQNVQQWLQNGTNALVIRHFAGSYELRLTFDSLKYKTNVRNIDSAKIVYADIQGTPQYNTSNSELFNVKVLNALSS